MGWNKELKKFGKKVEKVLDKASDQIVAVVDDAHRQAKDFFQDKPNKEDIKKNLDEIQKDVEDLSQSESEEVDASINKIAATLSSMDKSLADKIFAAWKLINESIPVAEPSDLEATSVNETNVSVAESSKLQVTGANADHVDVS